MDYYYMVVKGAMVVSLNADLDHHLADEIRGVLDEVIEQRGVKNVIFDFSKVNFMDSSGIGLIMGRYKKIDGRGRIAVVGADNNIRRILQISGLHKLVTEFATVHEAMGGKRNAE